MYRIITLFQNLLRAARGKGARTLLLALAVLLLTGCRDPFDRFSENLSEERDGIRITLWSRRGQYKPGEAIEIKATIENITRNPIVLEDPDEPAYDLCCYENGDSWADRHPDLVVNYVELAPGEQIEIEIVFVPVQAGQHFFEAPISVRYPEGGRTEFNVHFSILYAFTYND